MTLDNRVVMITGASSGLGEQIAYASQKRLSISFSAPEDTNS